MQTALFGVQDTIGTGHYSDSKHYGACQVKILGPMLHPQEHKLDVSLLTNVLRKEAVVNYL